MADYGFQWTDPNAPILNEKGAEDITFTIYSSKNASALDYNDMKIMQDLFESTNVNVFWENVSESVYTQQKNLIFSNKDDRPDAIYHAGMSAGEIIRYAKRGVLVAISDYLEYMPNFSKLLQERPDIYAQLINVEDGKIYSLPRIEEMGLLQNPNLLFLNKAWALEAINAGAVTGVSASDLKDGINLTASQMEQLLTYFRDHDMNGNGNNADERPLNFVYNNWQGNQCDLYGMFGLNDNLEHRVIVDGKVTYTITVVDEGNRFLGGAIVPASAEVILYMGAEKSTELCTVPDVVGLTPAKANTALVNAGLILKTTGASGGGSLKAINQSIPPGERVPAGTVVSVQMGQTSTTAD